MTTSRIKYRVSGINQILIFPNFNHAPIFFSLIVVHIIFLQPTFSPELTRCTCKCYFGIGFL